MNALLLDRYPGARPFADDPNDQRLFYGRDEEIDTLFHRVCAARLLVLFGKSGLGKTSLLQAGVFPKLRERHMLPLLVRLNIKDSPLNIIKTSASVACRNTEIDYTPGTGETLWEFFKTVLFWQGEILLTPVLVFDQFEEIFTLKQAGERADLARELGDLFRGTLPPAVRQQRQSSKSNVFADSTLSEQPPDIRVILSLREDFLGALQELAADIPGIFDDRVRLSPLSDEQAKRAICSPAGLDQDGGVPHGQFTTPPFAYADEALAEILAYLRGKSEVIEPFQLQLVCRDIEEQIAQQQDKAHPVSVITSLELGGRKRLDKIVESFYQQTIARLPECDRQYAQRLCEEGLLNAEGFRLMLQENEILKSYKLSEEALAALVDARLLRKEPRLESFFYELSHDSLAQPILATRPQGFWQRKAESEANAAKRAQQAREAAEELLDYLVFDLLPDKLTPMGRLDIVEGVQKRVNEYYEKLGIEGQSASVLNRRGAAYCSEGDRLFAQDKLVQAQAAYQKFLDISRQNSENEPDESTWQLNMSIALRKLGGVLDTQDKKQEAQQCFQDGLEITQKLIEQDSTINDWQWNKSALLVRLGDMLNDQGKQTEARQYYQDSLEIMNMLTSLDLSNGGWQRDVSVSLDRIGNILNAQNALNDALQYYQDSLAIRQKLAAKDPGNTGWQRDLSLGYEKIANVFLAQKKVNEALALYYQDLDICERLSKLDLNNATWQRDLSYVYELILPLLLQSDQINAAAEIAKRRVAHELKQGDGLANQQKLAAAYGDLAWYELFNRNFKNAIDASEQGLKINADEATNTMLNANLAHGYLFSGQYQQAKERYLNYKDKTLADGRSFKQAVLDDFKELRKRGINHPDMKKIEKLLR